MDYSEFVHEYVDADGRTRYVVARRVGDWYVAPLTPMGYWLTGGACWMRRRRPVDVAGPLTYTYARREDAIRLARDLYGDDDEG